MILSDVIKIKISNNQIKYYKEKGYDVKGGNEIKEIKIEDLPSNSGQKIEVRCDYCEIVKEISLCRYNINTNKGSKLYACSRKCAEKKNKNTIKTKYNVDNISQSIAVKNKKMETCLKNHGVNHPQQKKLIFEKSLKTKKEKYDNENYNNSEKMTKTKIVNMCKKHDAINYNDGIYSFYCNRCHKNYDITLSLYHNRMRIKTEICMNCNPYNSNDSANEIKMMEFIKENYDGEIMINDRQILDGKELDIYLPELKIAFEYNGLYWHSELYKKSNYHKNKTDKCLEQNIQLIHVWEDDWIYKQEIVKSMILDKLQKHSNKIYARKTTIKEINDNKMVENFLIENHILGNINSKIKLGLFYNDMLLSVMTFGKCRSSLNKTGEWELLRFCSKNNTNVIGSSSKLLKYFINNYKDNKLITFVDKSTSTGKMYHILGFRLDGESRPNFYYNVNGVKKHRFNYVKKILVKQGYDVNKSVHQIMLDRKLYRIYDSGNLKFVLD